MGQPANISMARVGIARPAPAARHALCTNSRRLSRLTEVGWPVRPIILSILAPIGRLRGDRHAVLLVSAGRGGDFGSRSGTVNASVLRANRV